MAMAKQALKKLIYPFFLRGYDLCLPFGERSTEYFRHYGAKNIRVVPHVVDNLFFAENTDRHRKHREEIRAGFGIPPNAVCFLFCGKFDPVKRPWDLLVAMERLREEVGEGVGHLLLVGSGTLEDRLRSKVENGRLPVTLAGFLNQREICRAYAAADVLVLCSQSETWGLVVNEAMAAALPVIVSSSCGCIPELVLDGVTGYQYPVGKIDCLTGAMKRLLGAAERDRMGRAARSLIQSEYSVEVAVERFVGIVQQFCATQKGAGTIPKEDA
jgi:glycosyltransferase involved in cell wall biosynthesis